MLRGNLNFLWAPRKRCNFMKIYRFFLVQTLFFIIAGIQALAQAPSSVAKRDVIAGCGTDVLVSRLRKNPQYRQREEKMNQAILSTSSTEPLDNSSYVLPVVFHIVSEDPSAITDLDIINALKDLNDAFAKTGKYAASTGANTRIQFCLAQKDPDGGNTMGITRTRSFYANTDQDIEDSALKSLIQWDPQRYINIWYVTSIESEIFSRFVCGNWSRYKEGGYATMPLAEPASDGIVVSNFGPLLAHEMGHYLGLYHTFEGFGCVNNDCTRDGDRVCDTPPDGAINDPSSCNQPQNSCSTDTLSGFTVDVPDLTADFMDFGNDNCHNEFTAGQGARMRATIVTQRSGLLQNECSKPCAENIIAGFTRNNPYPLPGESVSFTNTSSGASHFEWRIDNAVVSTSANFSHTFSKGKFKVTLKAYNSNASCYSTYTDYVIMNCGVVSRFYPDKRLIASATPIYPDSIYFTNRSVNASSYQWLMSNDAGMDEQAVGSSTDLNYIFPVPANYSVRLIASNGTCKDTSKKFNVAVQDPMPDGYATIQSVHCYQQTKLKVSFRVCENGFAPILPNTPVSFYDDDPHSNNAHKLGSFLIPDTIQGRCCSNIYDTIIDAGKPGLSQLYIVFNDNGGAIPLKLPNTSLVESNYTNNVQSVRDFQYKVSVSPAEATLEPGETLQLGMQAAPDSTVSIRWSTAANLSCTNCSNPVFTAGKKDTVRQVIATSEYGCKDSGLVTIKIPPVDDYTVNINNLACWKNDSLLANFTICNHYRKGIIPRGLMLAFYDADPASADAHLLPPLFINGADIGDTCTSLRHVFKGIVSGKIYAVVNDSASTLPVQLPNNIDFSEKDYSNNSATAFYQRDTLVVQPADTSVLRDQPFPLSIITASYDTASIIWFPGDGYTLSCFNCASPFITPKLNSLVKVQASNPYGCIDSGYVRIKTFTAGKVHIPNAFTPNGDGRNDVLYIMGGQEMRTIKNFTIFDRWGSRVFEMRNGDPNDRSRGWDGRINGQDAPPGTYVYFVTVEFSDGKTETVKGTITLIR